VKHVEFYSKNKFEKLVYLVGFIIRIYHDARSPERLTPSSQTSIYNLNANFPEVSNVLVQYTHTHTHISVKFQTMHGCLSTAPGGLPPEERSH